MDTLFCVDYRDCLLEHLICYRLPWQVQLKAHSREETSSLTQWVTTSSGVLLHSVYVPTPIQLTVCVCMFVNITIEYCLNGVLISADSFSLCILNYTATSIASNPFLFSWSKRKKVDKSCRMHNITTNGEHRKVTSNQDLHPKTQGFHQWIVLYVGEDDTWR